MFLHFASNQGLGHRGVDADCIALGDADAEVFQRVAGRRNAIKTDSLPCLPKNLATLTLRALLRERYVGPQYLVLFKSKGVETAIET